MSESTDKLEAQISEINDGLEAAIKGMHRATIRNEFADKVEAQIEDIYRERARAAVAQAKLDAFDAAEANAAPVEPEPEHPQAKVVHIGWVTNGIELAIAAGFFWLLFRYGVSVEGAIGGLIGAYCGYSWDRKKHRASWNHARIYDGWENPETYPKFYDGMFASMFIGMIVGMGVVGLLN